MPPTRLNPELPARLEEIINKVLEKDRKLRCQSAAELRADLSRLKRDTDSGRSAVAAPAAAQAHTPPRSRTKLAIGAVVLVSVAVAVAGWFYKSRATGGETIDSVAVLPFVNASADPNVCTPKTPAVPGHTTQARLASCEQEYRISQKGELPCQKETKMSSVVCSKKLEQERSAGDSSGDESRSGHRDAKTRWFASPLRTSGVIASTTMEPIPWVPISKIGARRRNFRRPMQTVGTRSQTREEQRRTSW